MQPFTEFGIVLMVASFFGWLAHTLKQPPLVGYIVAGFILGPLGIGAVQNAELLKIFSQFGITLLVFLVGLELDWYSVRRVGKVAARLSIVQIIAMLALGFGMGRWLGLPDSQSIIIGLALGFSSTIVVIKLISAKNEVQSLYGKLSVGILLLQDLIAIGVLILLPQFAPNATGSLGQLLILMMGKVAAIILITAMVSRWILPKFWHNLAHNRELMVLSSIGWCFGLAMIAKSLGFSYEIGAFVAGLSLASLPYNLDIKGQVRPLRDFFIVIFFVLLGFSVSPTAAINWGLVSALTLTAVIIKPLILMVILASHRFRIRTSYYAAFSLGQMSEFSVILVLTAVTYGYITPDLVGTIIIATAITLAISSYVNASAERVFNTIKPLLKFLERKQPDADNHLSLEHVQKMDDHIILFGYHRMGFHILRTLRNLGEDILVVDFDPDIIAGLRAEKIPSMFGDAADPDILENAHIKKAKMVISTIPNMDENMVLIKAVKSRRHTTMIATALDVDDALKMYKAGADYVVMPHFLGGEHLAEILNHYRSGTLKTYFKNHRADAKLIRTKNHSLYIA